MSDALAGLLTGVRVVEFSQLIAAPLCGLTLLDYGAEVIKVEAPRGEYTRTLEPILPGGESAYFQMLNRGKRGVALDTRSRRGRAFASRLIESADVVIESLGASAAGLESYEQVRQRHPKLIWCAITGTGHGNGGRAIDPSLQASMGMMALTGEAGRAPMRLPVPLVDFMTGMYALQAILAALMQVRAGGDGMLLDCALLDSAATLASTVGVYALNGPEPLRRMGTESVWYVPASNFPAADGQWVQVMAINDGHWRGLCRTLGHPEWIDDPRMADNAARVKHRELVHGLIGSAIATDTAEHWAAAVTAAGGFCQQIREIEEAWSDPLLVERRLRAEGEVGGVPFQVPVASLARTPLASPLPPGPRLGEHSEAIAAELGLPPAEIAELLDERVLVRG